MLRDFGPPNPTTPLYPFVHLQTDKLWCNGVPDDLHRPGLEPRVRDLVDAGVAGGLPADVRALLRREPDLLAHAAEELVTAHFPASLQDDVLSACGLGRDLAIRVDPRRDPAFREHVLETYGFACAACAFDLALGRDPVGLEAAHIKWVQALGPDAPDNGLALCVLHHKLFDLGAWRIDDDLTIRVSDKVRGTSSSARQLLDLNGQPMARPIHDEMRPNPAFVAWHRREVFKGRDRPTAR